MALGAVNALPTRCARAAWAKPAAGGPAPFSKFLFTPPALPLPALRRRSALIDEKQAGGQRTGLHSGVAVLCLCLACVEAKEAPKGDAGFERHPSFEALPCELARIAHLWPSLTIFQHLSRTLPRRPARWMANCALFNAR
jgi:hypothetical protein